MVLQKKLQRQTGWMNKQTLKRTRLPAKHPRSGSWAWGMALLGILVFQAEAWGQSRVVGNGLLVAPVKLEMGARKRTETITVKNHGPERTTYRLKMVAPLDSDGGNDASGWVRFSPRRISLDPGESQIVRVLVRKPGDLPPGDYMARLLVQAIPPAEAKAKSNGPEAVELKLTIVYGVTIPITIDHES